MYPIDKCYFCNYPLTDYGECYAFPCRIKYQYCVTNNNFNSSLKGDICICFRIKNYGFEFQNKNIMRVLELDDKDIIIAEFIYPEWVLIDKENYFYFIQKIKKLQVFK